LLTLEVSFLPLFLQAIAKRTSTDSTIDFGLFIKSVNLRASLK